MHSDFNTYRITSYNVCYTKLLRWGGEQAAWWAPMAIAVIVGLSFATVLTLVLVPAMVAIQDDVGNLYRRYFTHAGLRGKTQRDEPRAEPEPEPARAAGRSFV